ncbi:MAG: aspartyl/asparaginyl beta-hydroxylase domain-containing protein [Ignavibacteriota bacterium]
MLEELRSREEDWLVDTGRQNKIRVQRDTNTIFLSTAVHRPDLNINENQETRLTSLATNFPKALAFLTAFAQEMNCHLSRATIVRLKPKSQVYRHIDEGSYYFLRDRFHLVLQSPTGSVLMSGGETVCMQEGELWWFDNKQYHESYNESGDWRTHYIFDLLPAEYSDLTVNPVFLPRAPVNPPVPRPIATPGASDATVDVAAGLPQPIATRGASDATVDVAAALPQPTATPGTPNATVDVAAEPPQPITTPGASETTVDVAAAQPQPITTRGDSDTTVDVAAEPLQPTAAPGAPDLAALPRPPATLTHPDPGQPSHREIVASAIREAGIVYADQQRLISPTGESNRWLIDLRRVFMDAKLLDAAADYSGRSMPVVCLSR